MKWAFVPNRFLANPAGDFTPSFSSMFMHAGWLPLGSNMLYLWIFGETLEDRFGHRKFIVVRICGLATFAQLAFSVGSDIPNLGIVRRNSWSPRRIYSAFPAGEVKVLQGQRVIQVSALIVIGLWIVLV